MGGKQRQNRKHLLFHSACFLIMIFMIPGCIIPAKRVQVLPEGGTPIEQASMLVRKGKYNDALNAYSRIARSYPRDEPGDQALFEMGLIWAYPGNPKKNYYESLKYFNRLLHDFPRSPLKEEARAWAEVLGSLTRHNGQLKELEDKISSCSAQVGKLKEQINSYEKQISAYKEQISALKEIDIGIEEKKRKGLPEE
ncbi:MAG: hypothetical protein JXL81_14370 [Deltaproteobacteria bacterium]|nr:hypothetical protein [Deltaproteobacteria bacterium]